jgi:hypothetical protein
LLAGLLCCRRCGRKLTAAYTGGNASAARRGKRFLRYEGRHGYLDNGEPKCISFGGMPVHAAIGREILRVIQPGALEAAVQARQEISLQQDAILEALKRDFG